MEAPAPETPAKGSDRALFALLPIIAVGLWLGYELQVYLYEVAKGFAKESGIPKFLLAIAAIFGPLIVVAPLAPLLDSKRLYIQLPVWFVVSVAAAGYVILCWDFITWFISLGPSGH